MKFYVASCLTERDKAKRIMDEVRASGNEISLDWTNDSYLEKPYAPVKEIARERAQRDINAVMQSDVFVLLTEKEAPNKGMYVELGAAIACAMKQGHPKIYVLGDFQEYGMFFFHPIISIKKTILEVLGDIQAVRE